MTLEDPKNVIEFIREEPVCWVYSYTCLLNRKKLYAVFIKQLDIDIHYGANVSKPVFLYGEIAEKSFGFTPEGIKFLTEHNS